MKSLPRPMEANALSMASLVGRCQELCRQADVAIRKIPAEREQFLARNLQDALQHLDLILKALEQEGKEDGDKGLRFLKRLTRGLSSNRRKGKAEPAETKEQPDLHIPKQGLQGNSWAISLPELLSFLAFGHKTGVLWVDSPDENFLIGLVDGEVAHASSDATPEGLRLGETLVGQGHLTRRELEQFLSEHEADAGLTGEALIEEGLIGGDDLRDVLVHQARQLFIRLIETKNAIFRFREGMEVPVAYQVSLKVPQLLLESARVQDELIKDEEVVEADETDEVVEELANAVTPEEWDAWNQEVMSELAELVLDGGGEPQTEEGASDSEQEHAEVSSDEESKDKAA